MKKREQNYNCPGNEELPTVVNDPVGGDDGDDNVIPEPGGPGI